VPLCILQRVAVIVAGVLFLVAAIHNPADRGARVYGVLIDLAAVIGIAISARHMWIIAQPPGTVAECGASLGYMMDVLPLHEVLGKVLKGSGECAKIDWHFLGLNMPTWVLISLVFVSSWAVIANFHLLREKSAA
jgi:disulfide bond formation protein DsbB